MTTTPTIGPAAGSDRPAAFGRSEADRAAVAAVVDAAAAREVAEQVAAVRRPADRVQLARSPWLGADTAARLARSAATAVRVVVAENGRTPARVLARLATDPQRTVRVAALDNPRCPWQQVAAADRREADPTGHPDCPVELLVAALSDPRRRGRDRALRHPRFDRRLRAELTLPDLGRTERWALLGNPTLTHAEALELITDGDTVASWQWAKHPNADPGWLAELAEAQVSRSDQGTIARIAANPATPADTLAAIVTGLVHRDLALGNPSCPTPAMLHALDRDRERHHGDADALYGRARRALIARNPAATLEVLARITARDLSGAGYRFVLAHATNAAHAETLLTLLPTWPGSLADLLQAADAAGLPPL